MDARSFWIDNARLRTGTIQSDSDTPQKRPRFHGDVNSFAADSGGVSLLLWILYCPVQNRNRFTIAKQCSSRSQLLLQYNDY